MSLFNTKEPTATKIHIFKLDGVPNALNEMFRYLYYSTVNECII